MNSNLVKSEVHNRHDLLATATDIFYSLVSLMTSIRLLVLVLSLGLLLSCKTVQVGNKSKLLVDHLDCCPKPTESEHEVDCLVPVELRKLGGHATYLASRKAVKASSQDCEIRGGEYVNYDQATQASALRVWLPQALRGDAEAQRIVGEIYEQGIDKQSNPDLATEWYRRAATQNDTVALRYLEQINAKNAIIEIKKTIAPKSIEAREKIQLEDFSALIQPHQTHIVERTTSVNLQSLQELDAQVKAVLGPETILAKKAIQIKDSSDPIKSFQTNIEKYLATLKQASYAFNPPSPILVAKPTIVYLLIDPETNAYILAGKLKTLAPKNTERIDSGETQWAQVMEASLAGSDFMIDPAVSVRKTLSPTEPAKWSWVITPKHPGKKLLLSLTARAILPNNMAPPYEVVLLHKEIDVEVTLWWLFDHYFDKYWKWLLGGLAGLMTGFFSWWLKTKDKEANSHRKRTPFKIKHYD